MTVGVSVLMLKHLGTIKSTGLGSPSRGGQMQRLRPQRLRGKLALLTPGIVLHGGTLSTICCAVLMQTQEHGKAELKVMLTVMAADGVAGDLNTNSMLAAAAAEGDRGRRERHGKKHGRRGHGS